MPWYELVFDIVLGVLFVSTNVMYILHGLIRRHYHPTFGDVMYDLVVKKYHAFHEIWYETEMNTFGKILCGIIVGLFCCVGIVVLYIVKFIYWITHCGKESD